MTPPMIPVHFGIQASPLYGVLHPAAEPRRRRGLLVLGPWGWEALRAHRTLASLADRASRAGRDAFRFDYSGSGDSFGDPAQVSVRGWLDDAEHALDELLATAGVRRVALVGLRLGGLLAAELAGRRPRDVDRVVLWEAPADGGTFLRWMDQAPEAERSAFPVPDEFQTEVEALDLSVLGGFRGHLLWISDSADPPDAPEARSVQRLSPPRELAPCWTEDQSFGAGAVPVALLDGAVEWLGG